MEVHFCLSPSPCDKNRSPNLPISFPWIVGVYVPSLDELVIVLWPPIHNVYTKRINIRYRYTGYRLSNYCYHNLITLQQSCQWHQGTIKLLKFGGQMIQIKVACFALNFFILLSPGLIKKFNAEHATFICIICPPNFKLYLRPLVSLATLFMQMMDGYTSTKRPVHYHPSCQRSRPASRRSIGGWTRIA